MTNNIENWIYKNKAQIEALDDHILIKVKNDLTDAVRLFNKHKFPLTDEMIWQMLVVPEVLSKRGLS